MYLWIIVAVIVTVADQLSKLLISNFVDATDRLVFIPGVIDIVSVKNTGAAFSMFSNHTWVLGIVSALFCIGIVIYMIKKKPHGTLFNLTCGLLLGGALGNGIDRIARGFVIDFIETVFIEFPVFNIADIAITIGAALLIILASRSEKKDIKEG